MLHPALLDSTKKKNSYLFCTLSKGWWVVRSRTGHYSWRGDRRNRHGAWQHCLLKVSRYRKSRGDWSIGRCNRSRDCRWYVMWDTHKNRHRCRLLTDLGGWFLLHNGTMWNNLRWPCRQRSCALWRNRLLANNDYTFRSCTVGMMRNVVVRWCWGVLVTTWYLVLENDIYVYMYVIINKHFYLQNNTLYQS